MLVFTLNNEKQKFKLPNLAISLNKFVKWKKHNINTLNIVISDQTLKHSQ
jgi:hypothetical protein